MKKETILKHLPLIAVVLGAAILAIAFFMPFGSATEDYAEGLNSYPDEFYAEEIGMKNRSAVNLSLLEYARLYGYSMTEMSGSRKEISIVCFVIIMLIGVFSLLTLLFSVLKKPIPLIVFDVLSFASFRLIKWDFKDRGILPGSLYNCGIVHFMYHAGAVVALIGAIWLLAVKIREKKRIKAQAENRIYL